MLLNRVSRLNKWLQNYQIKKEKEGTDPRSSLAQLSGGVGVLSNLLLFVLKLLAGWLAGSVSIMADAVNNLSDSLSSVLTLLGFRAASKPPDKEHPYGHERFEYITGLIISIVILFVGYEFAVTSVRRILQPESITTSPLFFFLLVFTIVAKLVQGFFYQKINSLIQSVPIQAASKDSFNDAFITGGVLVASVIETFTGWQIDGYVGLLIAAYIIYSGIQLIREAIDDLLGVRPSEELITEIKTRLDNYSSIVGYHDLLVHNYGPNKTFATIHIEVDDRKSLNEAHKLIDTIQRDFKEALGLELLCHVDPIGISSEKQTRIHEQVKGILKSMHPVLGFHDFRVVTHRGEETIEFDVVVPEDLHKSNDQLYKEIKKKVHEQIGPYDLEIDFDHIYLLKK